MMGSEVLVKEVNAIDRSNKCLMCEVLKVKEKVLNDIKITKRNKGSPGQTL